MADKVEKREGQEESPILTLVDEKGREEDYELLAEATIDGALYYAILPVKEQDISMLGYLRVGVDADGSTVFETVVDDDEFDKVDDYFNDLFFDVMDYDRK